MPNLFAYATNVLKLSEATACMLISVARASQKVPQLKTAIDQNRITLTNARRVAPIIDRENQGEWLAKAAVMPLRKLELELAAEALDAVLDAFLKRHDPVQKAERALLKTTKANAAISAPVARPVKTIQSQNCASMQAQQSPMRNARLSQRLSLEQQTLARKMGFVIPRAPVLASQRHQVNRRDVAVCTFTYADGSMCQNTRWLHVHHIQPVALGGGNSTVNLQTLCTGHHRILHG